jgi:hypothetical protein
VPYSIDVAENRSHITLKFRGTSGRPEFQGVLDAHPLGAKLGIRNHLVVLTDAMNPDTAADDCQPACSDFPAKAAIDRFAGGPCRRAPRAGERSPVRFPPLNGGPARYRAAPCATTPLSRPT